MKKIVLLLGLFLSILSANANPRVNEDFACETPAGLFVVARDSMAMLNWRSAGANVTYSIQWKNVRDSLWRTEASTSNSFLLRGINPCSEYQFRVKTICSNTSSSEFSTSFRFKTLGCTAPCNTPKELKAVAGATNAVLSWVGSGAIAYEINYKEASATSWMVLRTTSTTFTVPGLSACKQYQFRVRSVCGNTSAAIYSEYSSTATATTTGCASRCEAPRRLSFTVAQNNASAVLRWDTTVGATYVIQWISQRDSAWRTVENVRGGSYTLSNLSTCTSYMFRVKTMCAGTTGSAWSVPVRFTTGGCQPVCNAPREFKVVVNDSIAIFTWARGDVNTYKLEIKSADGTTTRTINVTGNAQTVFGLPRCKKFSARLVTVCSASLSSAAVELSFETRGCTTAACSTPTQLAASNQDTLGVKLSWSNVGARAYIVEYKLLADSLGAWRRDSSNTNTLFLRGLLPCRAYMVRVFAICANGITAPSLPIRFETGGCAPACATPTSLSNTVTADTTVALGWSSTATGQFEIQYRVLGTANWTTVVVSAPQYLLTRLERCKAYEWRVRRICSTTSVSEWSASKTFETKGCSSNVCVPPAALAVLQVDSMSAALAWTNVNAAKYYVEYKLLADSSAPALRDSSTTNSIRLRNLRRCQTYVARVFIVCSNGTVVGSSSTVFTTTGCVQTTCITPRELRDTVSQDTTAVLAWLGSTSTANYEVQIRMVLSNGSTSDWVTISASIPSLRAIGLARCTEYQWRVRMLCGVNSASEWSVIENFKTSGCGIVNVCGKPSNLRVETLNDSVMIFWNAAGLAGYELQYRRSSDSLWSQPVRTVNTMFLLRGLTNCVNYVVRVRAICTNGAVSDWVDKSFKPGLGCFNDDDNVDFTALMNGGSVKDFSVSPNPGRDFLQVAYKLENSADVKVEIMNLQGQVVSQLNGGVQEMGNYVQTIENLDNVSRGMYLVVIKANGKVAFTQKWIKQ